MSAVRRYFIEEGFELVIAFAAFPVEAEAPALAVAITRAAAQVVPPR
jgi:hypothetical protein